MKEIIETSKGRFVDEVEWTSDKEEITYEEFKTLINDFTR